MPGVIDLRAILIANLIGITILFSVIRGHWWRLKNPSREARIMIIMFFVCLVSCIMDPLSFWADGKPGLVYTILVFKSNTWLYIANIAVALTFHSLVFAHLGIRIHRVHKTIIAIPVIVLCALLVVNIFVPIVFSIENNVYDRTDLYWLYLAVEAAIGIDGVLLYLHVRRSSGGLKFFPVASFLVPAAIGIIIQTIIYGTSTMFPFYAVSFGSVATSLQNEFVFKDQLTGLYNRSFFNTMEKKLIKADREYVAMMLDINGFKEINDTYGHNIGDKALTEASTLLQNVVREHGIVIRYAGDEFIVILYNVTEWDTKNTIEAIHVVLDDYNKTSGNPYELSVSIGHCNVNMKEESLNDLVDKIDKLMYENKRMYYSNNEQADRRK